MLSQRVQIFFAFSLTLFLSLFLSSFLSLFLLPLCFVFCSIYTLNPMDGLQPIPRESNDKDVAAMLDELIIETNEESFVVVLQHGGNDVT